MVSVSAKRVPALCTASEFGVYSSKPVEILKNAGIELDLIFLTSMMFIPNVVLNSSSVNKQTFNTLIWSVGLLLNIALYYVAIIMGLGIVGIAWAAVGVQVIITTVLFVVIRQYVLPDKKCYELHGQIVLTVHRQLRLLPDKPPA